MDFRSIFLGGHQSDLASRKIASADATVAKSEEAGELTVSSAFRVGQYCIGQRLRHQRPASTDEQCHVIARWSDKEPLLLDTPAKPVRQWRVATGE